MLFFVLRGNQPMSDRFTFLTQAINDIQATIRAIDVKIGFLFVLLFLPSTQAAPLKNYVQASGKAMGWEYTLLLVIMAAWLLSVYMLFMSVGAISNPSKKVAGVRPSGIYHGSGLFDISFIDLFTNSKVKSDKTVDQLDSEISDDVKTLEKELIYELLKVSYVRDIKAARFVACLRFTFFWVAGALLLIGVDAWRAV